MEPKNQYTPLMHIKSTFLILILSCLLLQYCSSPQDPSGACTAEFVTFSVTVVHPDGSPADSVDLEVRNREDGNLYNICAEYSCRDGSNGNYTIMHDGFLEELSPTGETVLVEGTKGNLQFSEEYTFQSGRCHVEKVAGPDTVSLSNN